MLHLEQEQRFTPARTYRGYWRDHTLGIIEPLGPGRPRPKSRETRHPLDVPRVPHTAYDLLSTFMPVRDPGYNGYRLPTQPRGDDHHADTQSVRPHGGGDQGLAPSITGPPLPATWPDCTHRVGSAALTLELAGRWPGRRLRGATQDRGTEPYVDFVDLGRPRDFALPGRGLRRVLPYLGGAVRNMPLKTPDLSSSPVSRGGKLLPAFRRTAPAVRRKEPA